MSPGERVAGLLGVAVAEVAPVAGGDLSAVYRVRLVDERLLIVKGGGDPATEAAMLDAIRARGVPTPAVVAHDDEALVLEDVPVRGRIDSAWQDLGRQLSRLHHVDPDSTGRYGWDTAYDFGQVPIDNAWSGNWPDFWIDNRLVGHLSYLPPKLSRRLESLARRLPELLPAGPAPSLLHGDLWTGNILVADGRVSGLIDPAAYFGDREVDFAMLSLFGNPGAELMAECETLDFGHERRRPIYQLWPAIVHVRLFGAAYHGLVDRLLRAVSF